MPGIMGFDGAMRSDIIQTCSAAWQGGCAVDCRSTSFWKRSRTAEKI